jgi:hypothetical protein
VACRDTARRSAAELTPCCPMLRMNCGEGWWVDFDPSVGGEPEPLL